jgi:CHAT domain-containing protein
VALGFEARRDLIDDDLLDDYRILHFATHGLVDDVFPELSAIALSAFAGDGTPLDGHLRAYELFGLDLRADLVVLSSCHPTMRESFRGDGVVSLTNGFLQAGARGVLVPLWSVSDRATAALMEQFYKGLLQRRLPPAQALQQAQATLWREGTFRAPYFWAGFVLHGEWR